MAHNISMLNEQIYRIFENLADLVGTNIVWGQSHAQEASPFLWQFIPQNEIIIGKVNITSSLV